MKKNLLLLLLLLPFLLQGQITTKPAVVTEAGAIEIIFNAAQGNQGLKGYTGKVYAHTGVITDKSTSGSDWKYAPTWGDNAPKYQLTSLGNNEWKLTLSPNIRSFYTIPSSEKILKLAFVFRSEDSKKEGKGEGGNDLFVTLNEEAFTPSAPLAKGRPTGSADGINYIDDQTVTLVVYAPGKEHIHLLGDFNDWKKDNAWQLYKDGDYWWYTLSKLEKGKEYAFQYLIDNSFKIADAYAEKILDSAADASIPSSIYPDITPYPMQTEGIVSVLQTGKPTYNWQVKNFSAPKGEELVIYELLIRDFTQESSIQAVTAKLDYLKDLGVNAIELMPIQEFDGNDSWGYNPCFYFAPDKAYGTPNAYKQFIDEAHRRGMAVIIDVVFNHATSAHPFARLYWDGSNNRPAGNNPWFNPVAPHPYSVFNDFNHEYQGTRTFFKRVLSYWLTEYKVDGFRFDLTKGLTQKQSTEATASVYDASRITILKDYYQQIQQVRPGAYTILEHFCDNKEEKELADSGLFIWGNINNAYSQSLMGWKENSDLSSAYAANRGWTHPLLIAYQESHDEERTLYKAKTWGSGNIKANTDICLERAALNAAFLLCTPGPKMIWQFGELGYDYSIEENGRTGRKPVRWDYMDDPARATLYDSYARLLTLRTENPNVFSNPSKASLQTGLNDWEKGRRICLEHADMDLVLVGNFDSLAIRMKPRFPQAGLWSNAHSGVSQSISEADKNEVEVTVPAHSYILFTHKSADTANEKISKETDIYVYMDATGKQAFVQSKHPIEQICVYSAAGSRLITIDNSYNIDLSDLSSGIYILLVQTRQGRSVHKVMLQP